MIDRILTYFCYERAVRNEKKNTSEIRILSFSCEQRQLRDERAELLDSIQTLVNSTFLSRAVAECLGNTLFVN